ARAGVELVERGEQRLARDDVDVDAGLVVVPVFVVERPLGAALLRDVVLQGREHGAEGVAVGARCCAGGLGVRGRARGAAGQREGGGETEAEEGGAAGGSHGGDGQCV